MEDWIIRIAWYAAIGLIAGYLASRLMKQRGNPVYYMLLGVAGALIGGVLWTILGSILSFMFNLVVATVGAIILILIWRGYQSKKRWR
jgi:uncharacterized membrane protein YeaQ/YmgE (transglycosylase-associated protein family)